MSLLKRAYDGLHAGLGLLCGLLVGAIVIGITLDVALRNFGLGSIPWVFEANEYALFAITTLGAPWALKKGAHVRVDVLVSSLPPRAARVFDAVADSLGLIASSVLLYYSVKVARAAIRDDARIIKMFIFPEWWIFGVMALAATLLIVEFTRRLVAAPQTASGVTGPTL